MSAALVTLALGAPEWWTGPEQTGSQLLESGAFAEQFVAKETTADLVEIRRIVFQMLGMDHLVLFIDACCNYLRIDVDAMVSEERCTKEMKAMVKAINAVMKAKKQRAFDEDNISRLLYFALECGLELEPATRHMTLRGFRKQEIEHFGISDIHLRGFMSRSTMTAVEMLTKMSIHSTEINGAVARAVLACTTFNASTIFDKDMFVIQWRTRLYASDSGSAVWFDVLDMLFVYHQRASPASSSLGILAKCLQKMDGVTIMNRLVEADRCDEQRRMLPYLLGKPDLSDGSIIVEFYQDAADIKHFATMAELCKNHPDWPRTCVKLVNMFANCRYLYSDADRMQFITYVNHIPGMDNMTLADIANYISADLQMNDACEIGKRLMQTVVKYATFDTELSLDVVFEWMLNHDSYVPFVFAERLYLTHSVAERAAIYERFVVIEHSSFPGTRRSALIYYLMHGEEAFNTYTRSTVCNIHLVLDMLAIKCESETIAYIISAACKPGVSKRDHVPENVLKLCKRGLRFDLLMRLVKQHYHTYTYEARTEKLVEQLETSTYYEPDQLQLLIAYIQQD
ncbi:hypothetical protein JKY72_07195 [Candidatus Gracilibacteria bacterium]|nr:hypothetical protein [Candidatus Gracilibacteria bacterium]